MGPDPHAEPERDVRSSGFTVDEIAALVNGGVRPAAIRALVDRHRSRSAWLDSPVADGEDPQWRHLVAPASSETAGGVDRVAYGDGRYPAALTRLSTPPVLLHVEGDRELLGPAVAVVGSRAMSRLGRVVAGFAVDAAAAAGAPVISGGAEGVDETAMRAAIGRGVRVVMVAGAALDRLPPRQRILADDVIAAGGAVCSELVPGTVPSAGALMARNRIIAACAVPMVVCEAALPSGSTHAAGQTLAVGGAVVVPYPNRHGIGLPGARGLLALAGSGGADRLGWPAHLLGRLDGHGPLANAVCETSADLTAAVAILWRIGLPARRTAG